MRGVKYLVDDKGEAEAVVIDLKVHRDLWEDIQDVLIARERLKAPRIPFDQVVERLRKAGRL